MKPLANTIRRLIGKLIPTLFSRFLRGNQGAVLVYVAAMLPVLVGGGLIVVDGARLFNVQTLLQKGADSLAVAGGRELDGRGGAIARATLAINQLIQNQHKFGAGGAAQVILDPANPPRFFDTLPANDDMVIDASFETAVDAEARFVEVTVLPVQINTIFPASFLGGGNTATTSANAVAGFNLVACDFTPVFICNPFEDTDPLTPTIQEAIDDPAIRRRHIQLKRKGGGESHYSPGNYGFLQPLNGPGANELRDMIGMSNPPTCFLQNGVELRPGFVATVRDAMNVRFDLWGGPMNSKKNDPNFRPARNVRKGHEGADACNPDLVDTDPFPADPPPKSRKLPRDNCFPDGCTHMGGRMGNGEWDFNGYWTTNFGAQPKPTDDQGNEFSCGGPGEACVNPPSRHDVYRYEIEQNLVNTPSPGGEMGTPQCSTSPTSDDPDRRHLFGAILNCVEISIEGGSSGPYPVEAFAKFFVTEAMQTGPDDTIWVELVDVFEPGGPGGGAPILRPEVQLYR